MTRTRIPESQAERLPCPWKSSHPTSDPVPSRRDVTENTYGETPWVIVGFAGEPAVRAWRLTTSGVDELTVTQ